ncbi:sterol desaturase family protein [Methylovulum psychrotolerans]|uniref:Sterol desaturase family protein n=2 Tax=Methylovulum psychrotolerans TaxID=1704499 RepID=A0A2S5CHW2_9GAMM|nr:sterol desaturase family protein [Methylovulum psychrotolerans]
MSPEIIMNQWAHLLEGMDQKALSLATWFLVALCAIAPLEKIFYIKRQDLFRKDFISDVAYFFLSGILPSFLLVITTSIIVLGFRSALPAEWFAYGQSLPVGVRIVAIIVVGDFGFYWAHRWAHEIPWVWRIHSIHHSPTAVDWLVATRVHPLEVVFLRSISFIPVCGLGLVDFSGAKADLPSLLLLSFNNIWGIFIHANVKFRFGWLEQLISTPHFHHWHHANGSALVVNKNYAALLPVYDRLFGTLHQPKTHFPAAYGISSYLPEGLLKQLVYPFTWFLLRK